jgi:hypothetical protein
MSTTTFWQSVASKAQSMQANQRQEVKAALRAGAQPISLGRYCPTGGLVLKVTMPDQWHGEIYDRFRHAGLSCVIPPEWETQWQDWYTKKRQAV